MTPATKLDKSTLESFTERVWGEVLTPGDDGFDDARTVWNAKIDKEPAVIARCTGAADVMAAVDFAREEGLDLAIKGGGHHITGHAVCDEGLVIDLAPMNGVRVDPDAKTARVQGGATWGDFNHEAWTFGLDIVGMSNSPEVGVAGFTLGGGMAVLSNKYGLAIDNLRAVDIVTADGELVHASEEEHADLFWALRGGGGNFGVVTSFEFECHEVTFDGLSGQFVYPVTDTEDVLRFTREFVADAPDEVVGQVSIRQLPNDPAYPEDLHGKTVTILSCIFNGDIEAGKRTLQPLQEFGDPLFEAVRAQQYTEIREDIETDQRNYWNNHLLAELSDDAIETFASQAAPLPSPSTIATLFFGLGGAVSRVDREATAFPHRDATYKFELTAQWSDPADDEKVISWAREFHEAMAPYATGEYVNNQTDDSAERVRAAYDDNYDRLVEVKTKWDPENLFRLNQNIEPSG